MKKIALPRKYAIYYSIRTVIMKAELSWEGTIANVERDFKTHIT
jgi:hypothetical protein